MPSERNDGAKTSIVKKCPYCAEEIQEEAIKCRHCGEFLDESARPGKKIPWYFRTVSIVIAVCCVGPLALPMVWWRPNTSPVIKIILTIIILLLTWAMYQGTMTSLTSLQESLELMTGF